MEAVIFDMDGVIIDSEPMHAEADLLMLSRLGINPPEGYLDRFIGTTGSAMWNEILDEFGVSGSVDEIMNAQLSLKVKLLKKGDYRPIEGIAELMAELRKARVPVFVASSSPSLFIKEVLKKLGLERFIEGWVSGESVKNGKPEPDIFLKAAQKLGVEPASCVVIEDSAHGVRAAKAAGMACVGFRNPSAVSQDLSRADLIVDRIGELTLKRLSTL